MEVVLFFAQGRAPFGSAPGAIYLLKDSIILPYAPNRLLPAAKSYHVQIN